jgi:hypothetical protein
MRINKFYNEQSLGWVDDKDYSIWINANLSGVDCWFTLWHEYVHYFIFKIFGKKSTNIHMIFDMLDCIIGNWSLKQAIWYYNYYKNDK